MKKQYPDSLFIVTGDHGAQCSELQHTSLGAEYTFQLHSPVLIGSIDSERPADTFLGNHISAAT